ncbi:hypothetical protein F7725_012219, partial [Dissostichus mawsoni]
MSSFNEKFSSYTMSQLNEVLEDDEKLSDMVQDMEEMHGVQQSKETTLVSNRTLAEQNLDLQPRLAEEGDADPAIRPPAGELRTTHQETPPWTFCWPSFRRRELNRGGDRDMPLDSFIDSYQSNRKLAHLRRVKIEKLQEMLMNGHRLPTVPNSRSQDVPSSVASLINGSSGSSPTAQPRRKNPPSQPAPILNQYPAAEPSAVYSPYPPIPPRTGQPFPTSPLDTPPTSCLSTPPPCLRGPPLVWPRRPASSCKLFFYDAFSGEIAGNKADVQRLVGSAEADLIPEKIGLAVLRPSRGSAGGSFSQHLSNKLFRSTFKNKRFDFHLRHNES